MKSASPADGVSQCRMVWTVFGRDLGAATLNGILNDTRFLQISAAIQPGNSGGPLLDTGGQVVGVVAAH